MDAYLPRRRIAIFLLLSMLAAAAAAGFECATQRVSVNDAGQQGAGHSFLPSISADGRLVAFTSGAPNLVAGDTNGRDDVFVRDRDSGTTARVSVGTGGVQANAGSFGGAISADGRYVAFDSTASNLVAGDSNGDDDIFVRDRQTGATTRVSIDSAGGQAAGDSYAPSISGDGRYVAFYSAAPGLVENDTNTCDDFTIAGTCPDVFVHDRQTGATARGSVDSAGVQGNHISALPAISRDGRYVSFTSQASNLVAGDTNVCGDFTVAGECLDIFVHDRQTGATERLSLSAAGGQGNDFSIYAAISADGRYVAFVSVASNLVSDTNGVPDVFVRDRQTGATARVSVSGGEAQADFFSFYPPAISHDGRYVAFSSFASNLVPNDTNQCALDEEFTVPCPDIFVRDRQAGTTERVSESGLGHQSNGLSFAAAVSDNAAVVAFDSDAASLVAHDTNGAADVFIRIRSGGAAAATVEMAAGARGGAIAAAAPDPAYRQAARLRGSPWAVGSERWSSR